jgi:hypothetical protein
MSESDTPGIDRRTLLAAPWALALPLSAGAAAPTKKCCIASARRNQRPGGRFRPVFARITTQIFEALYGYDHLAGESGPVLADGMPET